MAEADEELRDAEQDADDDEDADDAAQTASPAEDGGAAAELPETAAVDDAAAAEAAEEQQEGDDDDGGGGDELSFDYSGDEMEDAEVEVTQVNMLNITRGMRQAQRCIVAPACCKAAGHTIFTFGCSCPAADGPSP